MARLLSAALLVLFAACAPRQAAPVSAVPQAESGDRPAWVEDAVLYEVFVRSATPEGTLRALIPRLDGLQAMGVTTLWLMPFHPVGVAGRKGRLGSPYSVRDYRGVDPAFGTHDDFRALVEAVHDRGMTLILDWVANHTARDHAWTRLHPEWYTQDDAGHIVPPAGTDWTDVADLDYDEPALREAMIAEMRYWVEEFGIDGFRFDVAGMVPQDFWEEALAELSATRPLMLLAEGDDPWLYDAGFHVTYAWNTHHALRAIWNGAPADTLFTVLRAEAARYPSPYDALRLRFITNHDETSWADAAVSMYGGVEGTRAAMAVAATLPGIPLVYNGQEVAAPQRMNLFEDEKIDWSLNPGLRDFYATLLRLSREHREALRFGGVVPVHLGPGILAYHRDDDEETVFVVVNTRAEARAVQLADGLLEPGMREVFTGAAPETALTLEPYGVRIYTESE
jgi:glycosidase